MEMEKGMCTEKEERITWTITCGNYVMDAVFLNGKFYYCELHQIYQLEGEKEMRRREIDLNNKNINGLRNLHIILSEVLRLHEKAED